MKMSKINKEVNKILASRPIQYKYFGWYKKIRPSTTVMQREMSVITANSWGGEYIVKVYFPRKLTPSMAKKVGDFLIGELDDHEAYNRFISKIRGGMF